jgi:hypothetical protein
MTLSRTHPWSLCATLAAVTLACAPAHAVLTDLNGLINMWEEQIKESARLTLNEMKIGIAEGKVEQKITARNMDTVKRKAYWTALGCVQIVDGVTTVCHSEEVNAGATGTGTFKKGTSQREVKMRRMDKNDKTCRSDVDINQGGAVGDLKITVGCGRQMDLDGPPSAPAPRGTVLNISSDLDKPVTVVIGWESCTGTYKNLQHICATVVMQPRSKTSVTYDAGRSMGRGSHELHPGEGMVSWIEDDNKASVPQSAKQRKNVLLPSKGDRVMFF